MREIYHGNRDVLSSTRGVSQAERDILRNIGYTRAVNIVNYLLKESGLGTGSFFREGKIARSKGKRYWSEW